MRRNMTEASGATMTTVSAPALPLVSSSNPRVLRRMLMAFRRAGNGPMCDAVRARLADLGEPEKLAGEAALAEKVELAMRGAPQ